MSALYRFRDDPRPPAPDTMLPDLLRRGLLPTVVLMAAGLALGWLVIVPLSAVTHEDQLSVLLQSGRSPGLDNSARLASAIGSVAGNLVICVVSVWLVWLVSRQWWLAILPALALQIHVNVHIVTSTLVGRARPAVEQLDIGQPTASFPSGHVGATTAQLLMLVLCLCQRPLSRLLKVLLVVIVTGYLVWLGWSRLYLGMHHLSDVLWGAVNGVACALIAWFCLRRQPSEVARKDAATDGPGRQLESAD